FTPESQISTADKSKSHTPIRATREHFGCSGIRQRALLGASHQSLSHLKDGIIFTFFLIIPPSKNVSLRQWKSHSQTDTLPAL
ncbi:MAG: hypothetical protein J7501_04610, partial [Bdellovibrio sp.]|nr:hypothetical protein [Bdellovibrio sp.]